MDLRLYTALTREKIEFTLLLNIEQKDKGHGLSHAPIGSTVQQYRLKIARCNNMIAG